MRAAIWKADYHASMGRSVTAFTVPPTVKWFAAFAAVRAAESGPERRLLRDSITSGIGGKVDLAKARQNDANVDPSAT
jgi:hypothetical protein